MKIRQAKKRDLQKILQNDPAATSAWVVKRTYTGYKALCAYRYAHKLWLKGMKSLALYVSFKAKEKTGIDIHPAANIGSGIFIDHGVGLVIGETTEIGDNCVLYQGVTLGGTGKDTGKRHATLDEGVMVSAGAKVLGPVHIGAHSKIGAGSVVLKDVPPYSTVVGVPGRIIKIRTCDGCANKGKEACCLSEKSLSASSEKTVDIADSSSGAENQNE